MDQLLPLCYMAFLALFGLCMSMGSVGLTNEAFPYNPRYNSAPAGEWNNVRGFAKSYATHHCGNNSTQNSPCIIRASRIGNSGLISSADSVTFYAIGGPNFAFRWIIAAPANTSILLSIVPPFRLYNSIQCQKDAVIIRMPTNANRGRLPPLCSRDRNGMLQTYCGSIDRSPAATMVRNSTVIVDYCTTHYNHFWNYGFNLSWSVVGERATCVHGQIENGIYVCHPGYGGSNLPCHYGMVNQDGHCLCDKMHTGTACDKPLCKHGEVRHGTCDCRNTNYEGTFCQIPKCQHGRTVPLSDYGILCACYPQYFGKFCEERCVFGHYSESDKTCNCFNGYAGRLCDYRAPINEPVVDDSSFSYWSVLAGSFLLVLLMLSVLMRWYLVKARRNEEFHRRAVNNPQSRNQTNGTSVPGFGYQGSTQSDGFSPDLISAAVFVPVMPPPNYEDALKLPVYTVQIQPSAPVLAERVPNNISSTETLGPAASVPRNNT